MSARVSAPWSTGWATRVVTVAAVLLVATVAAVVSFAHMREVLSLIHISEPTRPY